MWITNLFLDWVFIIKSFREKYIFTTTHKNKINETFKFPFDWNTIKKVFFFRIKWETIVIGRSTVR